MALEESWFHSALNGVIDLHSDSLQGYHYSAGICGGCSPSMGSLAVQYTEVPKMVKLASAWITLAKYSFQNMRYGILCKMILLSLVYFHFLPIHSSNCVRQISLWTEHINILFNAPLASSWWICPCVHLCCVALAHCTNTMNTIIPLPQYNGSIHRTAAKVLPSSWNFCNIHLFKYYFYFIILPWSSKKSTLQVIDIKLENWKRKKEKEKN